MKLDTSINLDPVTREPSVAIQSPSVSATFWIGAVDSLLRNGGEWTHPAFDNAAQFDLLVRASTEEIVDN